MTRPRKQNRWAIGLSKEQREAVTRLKRRHQTGLDGEGWSVYMMPTTGQPKYLELRRLSADGRLTRWVIERDGSVVSSAKRRPVIAA